LGGGKKHNLILRNSGQRMLPGIVASALLLQFGASTAFATIDNTAVASGTYNSTTYSSPPSTVNVTVTGAAGNMVVTKTASDTSDVTAGQVITYTYTVQNSGNVTLTNVSLSENHDGSGPTPVPDNEALTIDSGATGDSTDATVSDGVWSLLAPGDTITFTSTYIVTQDDINNRQ
jgi:large repetitive protein